MTPKQALKMVDKFMFAKSMLYVHRLLTDAERDKIICRITKWAVKHGLREVTPRREGGGE